MVGREISIRRAKVALQLDGVALCKRCHGLQPERRRLGDTRAGNSPPRAADFRYAVQHQPAAHPRIGAGVDLVEQRRAEVPRAGDRRGEVAVADAKPYYRGRR